MTDAVPQQSGPAPTETIPESFESMFGNCKKRATHFVRYIDRLALNHFGNDCGTSTRPTTQNRSSMVPELHRSRSQVRESESADRLPHGQRQPWDGQRLVHAGDFTKHSRPVGLACRGRGVVAPIQIRVGRTEYTAGDKRTRRKLENMLVASRCIRRVTQSSVAAVENTASSPSRTVGTWGTSATGKQYRR
jgi:hypothetical protein